MISPAFFLVLSLKNGMTATVCDASGSKAGER